MKHCIVFLFLWPFIAKTQDWQAELMAGTSCYNGDLTQSAFSFKRIGPCAALNIKYVSNDFWSLRAGIAYARLSGDDRKNTDKGLQSRNLNFKTNVIEFSLCGELALVDPELYFSFPYIFGGVGIFHFDPYTYDKDNNKTFLRPLGTEGQGLAEYPDRKMYSLYQVCIPFGAGWKLNVKNKWEISYEFGYRILFTDYLDDVSRRYVSLDKLKAARGMTAAELSYRKNSPFLEEGEVRGNSKVKDLYFFNGIKIATWIGKNRREKYEY
jgi:hypothetical protein